MNVTYIFSVNVKLPQCFGTFILSLLVNTPPAASGLTKLISSKNKRTAFQVM